MVNIYLSCIELADERCRKALDLLEGEVEVVLEVLEMLVHYSDRHWVVDPVTISSP